MSRGRPRQSPSADQIYDYMEAGKPYLVSDAQEEFDLSYWSLKKRFDDLAEEGRIESKQHEQTVTYWIPVEKDPSAKTLEDIEREYS